MLFGGQTVLKTATTKNNSHILRLVENKTGRCEVQTHINFQTRIIFIGEALEARNLFNDIVRSTSLKIKEDKHNV